MHTLTTADRIAMYVGGGLLIVGTVLVGFLDMLLGAGHSVSEDGEIAHKALVPLPYRSYIIIAGLLILGLYVIYKIAATEPTKPDAA